MTCVKKLEVSVATPALFCLFLDKIWPLQNRKLLSQTTIESKWRCVMTQEVEKVMPKTVVTILNGYKAVNY